MPLNSKKEKGLTLTSCTNETKAYIYGRGSPGAPFGMITTDEHAGGYKCAAGSNASLSGVIGYRTPQTSHHATCLKTNQKKQNLRNQASAGYKVSFLELGSFGFHGMLLW